MVNQPCDFHVQNVGTYSITLKAEYLRYKWRCMGANACVEINAADSWYFLKAITRVCTWKHRASILLCADMNKHTQTHTSFNTHVYMTNEEVCVVYLCIIGDAIQ